MSPPQYGASQFQAYRSSAAGKDAGQGKTLPTKRVAFSSPIASSLSFENDKGSSSLNNNNQNSGRAAPLSNPTRSILRSQAFPSSSVSPPSLPPQFRAYRALVEVRSRGKEESGELSWKRKREESQSLPYKRLKNGDSHFTVKEENQTPRSSADPVTLPPPPPLRSNPSLESQRARRLNAQPTLPVEKTSFFSVLSGCVLS